MNIHCLAVYGLLILPLAACSKGSEGLPSAADSVTATGTQSIEGDPSVTLKLQDVVPQGYRLLNSHEGDLDGDGIVDVLLAVEDEANTSQVFGEGAKRKLLVCKAGADGLLEIVQENQQIIPCRTCGGVDGPYFELQVAEPGSFSVLVQGGSRERWTLQYAFAYDKPSNDWLLAAAQISVLDTALEDAEATVRDVSVSELSERRFAYVSQTMFPEMAGGDADE